MSLLDLMTQLRLVCLTLVINGRDLQPMHLIDVFAALVSQLSLEVLYLILCEHISEEKTPVVVLIALANSWTFFKQR